MSRKFFTYSALLASLVTAAALAGCGSDSRESGASLDSVAKVDEATCAQCHSASVEPLTGDGIYDKYVGSTHQLNSVGCQDCHGGGAMHNGVGPLPYPDPTQGRCAVADCHGSDLGISKYAESRHAIGELEVSKRCNRCHTHQGAVLADQSGYTGDQTVIGATSAAAPANAPGDIPEADAQHIKCNTCHVTHRTDQQRTVVGWAPSLTFGATVPAADASQYETCTSCHTYLNPDGTLVATGTTVGGVTSAPFYHYNRWYRMIASTHFDNPNTGVGLATNVVEGYVLRTNTANPCFDCHGHEMLTNTRQDETPPRPATIYTDWAKSAHGGQLLTAKYTAAATVTGTSSTARLQQAEAVLAAGSTDSASVGGPGWTHYNWDDNASRSSCQRCHTSTGLSNFLSGPSTYVAANNTFNHLSNWNATGGSPQNELLYCWGCHSNAAQGTLRDPGAITENYAAATTGGPVVTVTYPDISGSNVCMACHLGRETGENIKTDIDADGTRSFINSHYLSAGGQLFGTTGYEYDGLDYTNPAGFQHDTVGSTTAVGTGTNGPCAGCHMRTANTHSFLPVTKDGTGAITAINSTSCVACHTGASALTPAGLTTLEEEYQAALEASKAALAAKGIHFFEAHPYFYNGAGGTGGAYTTWAALYGVAGWKNTMGAAFNANLLIHDPGGYAHNSTYSKRLIWDAIDWIDDGILNNSTVTTILALETGGSITPTVSTEARAYLGAARP